MEHLLLYTVFDMVCPDYPVLASLCMFHQDYTEVTSLYMVSTGRANGIEVSIRRALRLAKLQG